MKFGLLAKEWRIWFYIAVMILCILFIHPRYVLSDEGRGSLETSIKQGLDLTGGVRALLMPEDNKKEVVDKSVIVLEQRINKMGLKETKVYSLKSGDNWYVQVEMAGTTEERMREILEKQGKFEARVNRHVEIKDEKGALAFGKDYNIIVDEKDILIEGKTLKLNDSLVLEDIEFKYSNFTANVVELSALVYKGEDVVDVLTDTQNSRVEKVSKDQYRFMFNIILNKQAAEKFAKVTEDVPIDFGSQGYLKENIDLYLDDQMMDSLRIGEGLKGNVATTVTISGPGVDRDDAIKKKNELQAILQSGAIPTKMNVVKIDAISPTLGKQFYKMAFISIVVAIIGVSILIFLRYRDPRIVLPIMMTSLSELLIILGITTALGGTLDLASIAGIIAAIGTGVNDQIIITDESEKKKEEKVEISLRQRLKNAFFIVFTAAFILIAAMVPLMWIGAGVVKGFAFVTIIGVVGGITVTRPAYGKVIEQLKQ